MIKKVIILIGVAFVIMIGAGKVSANTVTVKVEVISRNIENHTINVKTDDSNADKFTLKEVSAAQMDVANKGSIIKVTYDDNFNLSAIEKLKNADAHKSKVDDADEILNIFLALGLIFLLCGLIAYM